MDGKTAVHVNAGNWKSEVLDAEIPVLVDMWAEWCGPCRALAPTLDELAEELDGKIKVAKVNVDESQDIAGQLGIRSIPTLLVFVKGAVKTQMVGAMSKSALRQKIEPYIPA